MNKKSQTNRAGVGSKILVFFCMIDAFCCREPVPESNNDRCMVNYGRDRDNGCGPKSVQVISNRYCAELRPVQDRLDFTVCDGCNDVICQRRYMESTVGGLPPPADRDEQDAQCEGRGERRCYVPEGGQVVTCTGFYFKDKKDKNDPPGPELKATFRRRGNAYEVKWHMNNGLQPNTIKVTENHDVLIQHTTDGPERQKYLRNYRKYFDQCKRNVERSTYRWKSGVERTFFPFRGERGPVNNENARIYF